MADETFLGDGVYVSHDRYAICLRAPRDGGDHVVYIEPWMMRELIRYCERIGMLPRTPTS